MKKRFILSVLLFLSILTYSQNSEQDCENARKIYLQQNPDVAKAGMNAWSHYISFGKREGRKWPECKHESSSNEGKIKYEFNVIDSNENVKEFIFDNGDKYRGEYNDEGVMHGNGIYTFKNGNMYVGELKMGVFEGKGKLIYKNGDFYEGNWLDDNKDGLGKFTYANGNIYEGNFRLGYMEGKGKLSISNGNIYIGEFENGKMSGNGKYYYKNGAIYEGQFKDDKFNGQGTFSYKGEEYKGNFKNSIFEGYGVLKFANGNIYEGNFSQGNIEGKGKMTFYDGNIYSGDWTKEKMSGNGKYYFKNGTKYEGQFNDGKINGQGTLFLIDGDKYVGHFEDEKLNGMGDYFFKNGDVYSGNFKNNMIHGYGKFSKINGSINEGIWENGKLVNDYNKVSIASNSKSSESNSEDLYYSYLGASLFKEVLTGLSNMLDNKDSWSPAPYIPAESYYQCWSCSKIMSTSTTPNSFRNDGCRIESGHSWLEIKINGAGFKCDNCGIKYYYNGSSPSESLFGGCQENSTRSHYWRHFSPKGNK